MRALALSLLLLSSSAAPVLVGAGSGARLLLQSPWSPEGYHRNGYDEHRIECKPLLKPQLQAQYLHALKQEAAAS